MNKTLKNLGDIANLSDLRSISRTRRSSKPQLTTTAILTLSMARNERDRLIKEKQRLLKRKSQIDKRLAEIEKEMDVLLEQAQKQAKKIRGKSAFSSDNPAEKKDSSRSKVVIEY